VVRPSNSLSALQLDPAKDYIIDMPESPIVAEGGLKITGGRNVVLIGGEIHHPQWWPSGASNGGNRGLYLRNQTGTIHIEGLRITGLLNEGINLSQPEGAIVQLQNIYVDPVVGTMEGNHADLLQTWAGPRKLLIDGFTGQTTYQGLFLLPNQFSSTPPEHWEIHDIDIAGSSESGYLYWIDSGVSVNVSNAWAAPAASKASNRGLFLWPKTGDQWGSVQVGHPPEGDIVGPDEAGVGYRSPGYR
jgi:hypothetical protein